MAAVEASGAVSYFHTVRLGSVVAVSNGAGAASETYAYSPYGESANPVTGNPWRYTGRYLDAETGLYYYRARYYSPRLGQFLQTDPIGSKDDPNLYMYVGLDPGNATDPSGRFAWLIPAAQQCAANPVCRLLVSAAVREATRIILGPRPSGEIGPNIFVPAPQLPQIVTNSQTPSVPGNAPSVPRGKGVRDPTDTVDLEEELAVGEIVGDLETGGGQDITDRMNDPRYNPVTGTQDKVRGHHDHPDGTVTEVHADRNRKTGELTDVKIKDPPDNRQSRATRRPR